MLFAKPTKTFEFELKNSVAEFFDRPFNECTAEDVLIYLCDDDNENWPNGPRRSHMAVQRYGAEQDRAWYNRIGYILMFPIVLSVLPFVWIKTGEWGLDPNSKFGRFVRWIIGDE